MIKMIIPVILKKVKRCHLTSHQGSQNEIADTTNNINANKDVFFIFTVKYTHYISNKKPQQCGCLFYLMGKNTPTVPHRRR